MGEYLGYVRSINRLRYSLLTPSVSEDEISYDTTSFMRLVSYLYHCINSHIYLRILTKQLKTQFVMKLLRFRVIDERIRALIDSIMICKIWNNSENVFTLVYVSQRSEKYLGKPWFAIRDLGIQWNHF